MCFFCRKRVAVGLILAILGIFKCAGLEHLRRKAYTTPPLRILGVALRVYLSRFRSVGSLSSVNVLRWALKPDEAADTFITKLELI